MTARQPRRARRRTTPASALPRPTSAENGAMNAATGAASRSGAGTRRHREHHVTKDYSHVHKDLLTVLGVGVAVLAFIFGMSFVV